MATPFARIDLSDEARDYRPIALEPGVPVLDRSGANAKILFRWLGGMAAAPEWEGESVCFYVCDNRGGRLEDIACQPATAEDLKKLLRDEVETLKKRVEQAKPETATERALKRILRQTLAETLGGEKEGQGDEKTSPAHVDSHFFRYRDAGGRWRLVWCWGYRRGDPEPAPTVICSDKECRLLYVRHAGKKAKCPACAAALITGTKKKPRRRRLLLPLLFLLLLAALIYWWLRPTGLVVGPERLTGPVGSRVTLDLKHAGLFPFQDKDVTGQVPGIMLLDPTAARYDRATGNVKLLLPGRNGLRLFYRGSSSGDVESVDIPITAVPPTNPSRLVIDPSEISLGVGTTARPTLSGIYEDGSRFDLTEAALWVPKNDGIVYSAEGLLEGLGEGETTIVVRYRADEKSEYVETTAKVNVSQIDFQNLVATVVPSAIVREGAGELRIEAIGPDGAAYSVAESSQLDTVVEPENVAAVEQRHLWGKEVGTGTLKASLGDLTANAAFEVTPAIQPPEFVLMPVPRSPPGYAIGGPYRLHMIVGQVADIDYLLPRQATGDVTVTTADPQVAEYSASGRVIARSVGEAALEVTYSTGEGENTEKKMAQLEVSVTPARIAYIWIEPGHAVVPVDDTRRVRVLAQHYETQCDGIEYLDWAELAPDFVTCEKSPSPQFADFDPNTLELTGIAPTNEQTRQTLSLRYGDLVASAPVDVVVAPLRLAVTPAGPIEVPLGQMRQLSGQAKYSGGRRVDLPGHRMEFVGQSDEGTSPGLEVRGDRVAATAAGAGPLAVRGVYFGTESEPVMVTSVAADPNLGLRLDVDKTTWHAGELGRANLVGVSEDQDVELVPELSEFTSSDPTVLAIDQTTGAFRTQSPGEVTLTARHTASTKTAERKLTVTEAAELDEDAPVAVRILSDQGDSVRFPVGAVFDDFRVEAEYSDGFTRMVTHLATLQPATPPQSGPVSPSEGTLVGVRPGTTQVHASFEGINSTAPLNVDVTAELDADSVRIAPASITMLPGETLGLDVVAYKDGNSVGQINGLGTVQFTSRDTNVAQVDGTSLTANALGQTSVTAQFNGMTSEAADVNVVDSIADPLVVDPSPIRIRVGESVRVGTEITVTRGKMDVGDMCDVTPSLADIVEYDPRTHSLIGRMPGVSAVAFTLGDKLINAMVEVGGGDAIDGEVIIEPASGNLAPGQALPLRVLVVTPDGDRIDRTASAVLESSDPSKLAILGDRACAMSPEAVEVTAVLPGTDSTGRASITIHDQPIEELMVEPPEMHLFTGDFRRLDILGRAACGTHELFPQPNLKIAVGGANPEAIQIVGRDGVDALTPGEATVNVKWQDRLSQDLPVTVSQAVLTDLQIDPPHAVVHPGQPVVYQVTGLLGHERRVLGPEDGVELFVGDQAIAEVVDGTMVQARQLGRTTVMARLSDQQAEAALEVVDGAGPITDVVGTDVLVGGADDFIVYGPGGGYYGTDGYWVGDRLIGGRDIISEYPLATQAGLRFVPDVLRLATDSPSTPLRIVEVLADGSDGRDVTNDPGLELQVSQSSNAVNVQRGDVGPTVTPVAPGRARIGARLGEVAAEPMLVDVGGAMPGFGRLVVSPEPLTIWAGEAGVFDRVMVDPGGGRPLRDVDYSLAATLSDGRVEVLDGKTLRGLSTGATQVVVTAIDPGGATDGLSTTVMVDVAGSRRLVIEPESLNMSVGATVPDLAVLAPGEDGTVYEVPAVLESMDPTILVPDDSLPGTFRAVALGATQIRARYRGAEAFADITISGDRFLQVTETLNGGADDFDVTLDITAAESEGPLEYRVYAAGQTPPATWTPAQQDGTVRRATVRSPRMRYGPPNSLYHLIIESRDTAGGSMQPYPFTFRLKPEIERANR